MTAAGTVCPFGQGFDFTDPDVLVKGMPVAEFAELRKTAPVWWNEQPAGYEIADIMRDIAKLAEPQRLRSGWINGVKELSVAYRP